jgi:hypothetical protein
MKSSAVIEQFELVESKLKVFRREMAELSRKKPNEPLNKFKLGHINNSLAAINKILGKMKPLDDFDVFDTEGSIPTNSDVAFVLAQYTEAVFRMRHENTEYDSGHYYWIVNGKLSSLETEDPSDMAYTEK